MEFCRDNIHVVLNSALRSDMSEESSRGSGGTARPAVNEEQLGDLGKTSTARLKSVIVKDRKLKCPADDPTISISLGDEDTFSVEDQYSGEDEYWGI